MDLKQIVRQKIAELGVADAAKFFHVSIGTVSNWANSKTSPTIDALQKALPSGFSIGQEGEGEILEVPELDMWKGKHLQILLPVYRTFNCDTHFCLFANYVNYGPEKIGLWPVKRTVIHEARNIAVHKALKTDSEWFLFVDDDMLPPVGNAAMYRNFGPTAKAMPEPSVSFNAVTRIMSHGRDKQIVSGLYRGRHDEGLAQCSMGFENVSESKKLLSYGYSGLMPMRWVATGFMRMHRSVFETMRAAIDSGQFPDCKPANEKMWYGFFNPIRVGMGEDVSFCVRAKELGITSYLDASLRILHNGEKNY